MGNGLSPSREEVWRQFADELGSRYVAGDFWTREQIIADLPPWAISIRADHDEVSGAKVACTRLAARYITTDGFSFSVFRHDAFRDTGPLAAVPEIVVGDHAFDVSFRVAGSDRWKTLQLLSNTAIRSYLMAEPHIGLEAAHVPGTQHQAELVCLVLGIVETRLRLLGLFELIGETLQHLRALGSAADFAPTNVV